jgi:hypothetical protein
MLLKRNRIAHPLGIIVDTPLLVPSFSSKGFTFKKDDVSEIADVLTLSQEFLTGSLLISAYDIYHNHIPFSENVLGTELTILDSGGYETSDIYDLSATSKYSFPIKDWTHDKYEEVISRWPQHKAGIIVSYDHGAERHELDVQIKQAKKLFSKNKHFLSDFLIKPETNDQRYIKIEHVIDKIKKFKDFSIIGVTEKELGNSILDRMLHIAKIRTALDDERNSAPLHIFGSLDPISSLLYFFAGAEIFDGLTWLKYSYFNGSAIYQSNYGVLNAELGINLRDSQVRSKSIVNNIYTLEKMTYLMNNFIESSNFEIFAELDSDLPIYLKKSVETFQTRLNRK